MHFVLTDRSSWNISFTSDVAVISSFVSSVRNDSADEKNKSLNTGRGEWGTMNIFLFFFS